MIRLVTVPRAILAAILLIITTLIFSIIAILSSLLSENRKLSDWVTRTWSHLVLFYYNIKIEVEGLENIPESGGLYLFNHSSHFDIPIVFLAVPRTLRFGAKAELFRIPFFGRAMESFDMLKIHRGNRKEVLQLYKDSLSKINDGYNFVLAPEGTRGNGKQINAFKSGPFVMAISGQIPLIPVVLQGVSEILPKSELLGNTKKWQAKVRVQILPPHSTKGLSLDDRPKLQEHIREKYIEAYTAK